MTPNRTEPVPVLGQLRRFEFIPVPVHTGSGSHRFTVEADPLTGHNLGQISSPRRLSTIFVDQRSALVLFKTGLDAPKP